MEQTGPVSDEQKMAAIRAEFPVMQHTVYLNTGSNGPLPRRSHTALIEQAQIELEQGRVGMDFFARYMAAHERARQAYAGVLGCTPAEIALTHNTTEGLNIALMGLSWAAGDEVITARSEHGAALSPLAVLARRAGIQVRLTDIGLREHDILGALEAALSPRTRVILLSHVSWATGMILPIQAICELAHQAGALVICDAAQSCGMVPSKVYELGVDAYACSGQKWLCGPDGTGALFVRQDRIEQIMPTYVGMGGVKSTIDDDELILVEGARRYQAMACYLPALHALGSSIEWIGELGWPWAYARIRRLGQQCADLLAQIPGVTVYLEREQIAGLVHFHVTGIAPADLTARLQEVGIAIRHTPDPLLNRASVGWYTTEQDLERLAEQVRRLAQAA